MNSSIEVLSLKNVFLLELLVVLMITIVGPNRSTVVHAFTSGVGPCLEGRAALGSEHINGKNGRIIQTLSLVDANVVVTIGDDIVTMGSTYTKLLETESKEIKVTGPNLKGLLVRIEALDPEYQTNGLIVPNTATRNADSCTSPIVGVSHTDGSEKELMSATLTFPRRTNQNVIVDVSIVFVLNDIESIQAYGRFFIQVGSCDCGRGVLRQYIRKWLRQCNNVCAI